MSSQLQTRRFPARFTIILLSVVVLLSLPAIAMFFTSEVNWDLSDFVIAAILLFGTGILIELTLRFVKKRNLRLLQITG